MKQQTNYSNPDEISQVRKDLARVLILNGILLALLIGLFFWNKASGFLDQFFANVLKF
ncbi:MAG: hypothetical protein HY545_00635 [Candidatus Doudnabacteria bacterium]|nr:hypothetical protein [Candidatus Doudnabacteria bacterium]